MKATINFRVEPDTTYVINCASWDHAQAEAYDLARRMGRRSWRLTFDDITVAYEYNKAPRVQFA